MVEEMWEDAEDIVTYLFVQFQEGFLLCETDDDRRDFEDCGVEGVHRFEVLRCAAFVTVAPG